MDSPEHDAALLLKITLAECERLRLLSERSKRKDGFKLPPGIYETLEDIGRLESALAVLKTCWHKEHPEFRKASMHLSRLAWDLRKKLHEHL